MAVVDLSTTAGLELCTDVPPSKSGGAEKEQVWEQLTEEGPSGSSDSEQESILNLSASSASDTEQSAHDSDCISGLVSSSASDNEQEPKADLPPPMVSQSVPHQRSPRRSRRAPLAEVLSSKLLQVSAGRPVKVWLSPEYKPLKVLDPNIPAKKKPSFSEHAGKTKTLDPTLPVKKHMPEWLVNFGDSTAPSKPSSPKPPKMPLCVPQVTEPAPR